MTSHFNSTTEKNRQIGHLERIQSRLNGKEVFNDRVIL